MGCSNSKAGSNEELQLDKLTGVGANDAKESEAGGKSAEKLSFRELQALLRGNGLKVTLIVLRSPDAEKHRYKSFIPHKDEGDIDCALVEKYLAHNEAHIKRRENCYLKVSMEKDLVYLAHHYGIVNDFAKQSKEKGSRFTPQSEQHKKMAAEYHKTSNQRYLSFEAPALQSKDAGARQRENHKIDKKRGLMYEHSDYMHPHNGMALIDVQVRELKLDNSNQEDVPFLVLFCKKAQQKRHIKVKEKDDDEKIKPRAIIFQLHSNEAHGAMKRRLESILKRTAHSFISANEAEHQSFDIDLDGL
eukprot:CAMPEP_0194575664 /NCGR_PEP_ID=MMETSP0292-20121207/11069_1 /TAXON_ID=39354 /ORGANISM="Heterosigma akashiwo, Strain CCMP2393" /LENGTH=302 /DNA_ID=CAMNT_0039427519 /DNA_START=56 /DNA_END=964 /DNA_ORIENTATION=+